MSTIDEVEGLGSWGPIPHEPTMLMQRCYALRAKPLEQFSGADCRLLLRQKLSIALVLPSAVDMLLTDLWTEAEYHPGDLLLAVLAVPTADWVLDDLRTHRLVHEISNPTVAFGHEELPEEVSSLVRQAVTWFLQRHS